MEVKHPVSTAEKLVINCLAALGGILYIGLQCNPYLPLPGPDLVIKNLAFSLAVLIQIVRALLTILRPAAMPALLAIKKMDRRFAADTTVVFLVLTLIMELTIRSRLDPADSLINPTLAWSLAVVQIGLGGWLIVLTTKKSSTNPGVGLVALLLFTLVFLSPFMVAGGIAFAMYKCLALHTDREYQALSAATIMPMLIACLILFLKDKRDRGKNTARVIINQFIALPAVPIFYFLLKDYWPQSVNPLVFPLTCLIVLAIPNYSARRTRPWLVKERVETLLATCAINKNLVVGEEMEAEMQAIRLDLVENRLVLKSASDYIDRADAYWKFGNLNSNLCRYDAAEESYKEAISNFNRVLEIDGNNSTAISNKFKTVEDLAVAQALREQGKNQ